MSSSSAASSSAAATAEAHLQRAAARRPSVRQLFSPSLESDLVTPYMLHRRKHFTDDAWVQLVWGMMHSRTLYVGNLAFHTREEQVHELFARAGRVRRVIMGLNAQTRTPCGFAFVEMESAEEAHAAQACMSGLQLDGRVMRADMDQEFEPGRQFGRSRSGGQLQDDYRADFDVGRGGWGAVLQARQEQREQAARHMRAQRDTFGAEDEQAVDPTETVGRAQAPAHAFRLSASSIAALTPGVFPHYGLPVDARVQRALQHVREEAAKAAAAAQGGEAAAAQRPPAPGVASGDALKRPRSPPPADGAAAAAAVPPSPPSPPSKRARPHSPPAFAATSPPHAAAADATAAAPSFAAPASPQPLSPRLRASSPAPRSPVPFAATGARSPALRDTGSSRAGSPWTPPERGFTPEHESLSDGDRTPPPPPDDRHANHAAAAGAPAHPASSGSSWPAELSHDDATPPATPAPHERPLDDDAYTPPHADDGHHDDAPSAQRAHAAVDDDDETPPPSPGAHKELSDDAATP